MRSNRAILTFCHLRWDFVYQRPQHLLSRLAKSNRVIFVEEPVEGDLKWEFIESPEGVLVCRPHTPCSAPGFHQDQMPYLEQLVDELVEREALDDYVLWFYSPMALPLAEGLHPKCVV